MGKRRLQSQRRKAAAWAGNSWRWQVAATAGDRQGFKIHFPNPLLKHGPEQAEQARERNSVVAGCGAESLP
ncbi:hypothetical protein EJB05_39259 [Eragrostis curvula]|uniref:Uncharacterized protein n=1 Tax=Eragrostis curvula TaxID=38414 RepID=A0A5J9TYE5_9POAL|nr:hypothetical protein EJB05_39259 [Eragrostis curvula]